MTAHQQPVPSRAVSASLMLLATVFIASSLLCAKLARTDALGPPLHPLQVTQARFAFALLGILAAFAVLRTRLTRPAWPLHLTRTACGGIGVSLMFASVAFIPLSDATAISFLNPVFAMILAIPLLAERVGPVRWTAALIALAGALILLRPGPASLQSGALLALAAAMLFGVEIVLIKMLSRTEPALQVLLINNLIGCALFGAIGLTVWQTPSPAQWLPLAGVGLSMACAQACFVSSLARSEASFAVPFSYATLVVAALLDALVFGVWPDAISWVGAATILSGAALLAWREARIRQ